MCQFHIRLYQCGHYKKALSGTCTRAKALKKLCEGSMEESTTTPSLCFLDGCDKEPKAVREGPVVQMGVLTLMTLTGMSSNKFYSSVRGRHQSHARFNRRQNATNSAVEGSENESLQSRWFKEGAKVDQATINGYKGSQNGPDAQAMLTNAHPRLMLEQQLLRTKEGNGLWWSKLSSEIVVEGYESIFTKDLRLTRLEIMNADSDFGTIQDLLSPSRPSGVQGYRPKGDKATNNRDFIVSDTDEQLSISLEFNRPTVVHGIHLTGYTWTNEDEENSELPRTVKLFTNIKIIDFSAANNSTPAQQFELKASDWQKGTVVIETRLVKFKNVSTLVIFADDGLESRDDGSGHGDFTRLDRLLIIGKSRDNLGDSTIKRVVNILAIRLYLGRKIIICDYTLINEITSNNYKYNTIGKDRKARLKIVLSYNWLVLATQLKFLALKSPLAHRRK
ncbi:uncharacterized protein PAC_17376 [Phialocephala subalpina]|uniref:PITH domain-containing protein n=1 Tax=Phialocephala subalpina TaxID=576137 RepID=A0A1L7XRC1_9HELO|nr:uncharacterized protein PAC_17376 [Phialocephala subalpina]